MMGARHIVVLPMWLLFGAAVAEAHAFLDHADPRVGSVAVTPPREVTLWFTQDLEAAFSTVTVTDSSGQRVDAGKPSIRGNIMRVHLRPVRPGTYRVTWHALSVDTHTTERAFTFRVGQ